MNKITDFIKQTQNLIEEVVKEKNNINSNYIFKVDKQILKNIDIKFDYYFASVRHSIESALIESLNFSPEIIENEAYFSEEKQIAVTIFHDVKDFHYDFHYFDYKNSDFFIKTPKRTLIKLKENLEKIRGNTFIQFEINDVFVLNELYELYELDIEDDIQEIKQIAETKNKDIDEIVKKVLGSLVSINMFYGFYIEAKEVF